MKNKQKSKVYDMAYIALFAVLMAICSWIAIPMTVPFTLQTFAVFLTVYLLGGKRGTIAVLVYIFLGGIGLPVFSGFTGGVGILFGNTGGYIFGFVGLAIVMWAGEKIGKERLWMRILSMVLGLLVCYAIGTVWFQILYLRTTGAIGIFSVLGLCVFPFILPDLLKMALAVFIGERVKKFVHKRTGQ